MRKEPGFSSSDVLLAVTTLSFDIAVLELLLPLVSGGTVVIASRETVSDPARLIEAIRDSECTVMQGTPALWRSLVDAGWTGDSRLKILCGGEALRRNLADQLLPRCHELWNLYGPTETTIWSTVQKVKPGGNAIPIGRPIDNTQVYVLDRQLQILPPGITGELYIGGRGVARGYAGRPDLTAERFLPSPFVTGERLYRTGDLARWRSGGDLELLGRADQQVKVRGHRIELQEVEDVLAKAPGVRGSAVKAWRDASGENALVAYIEGSPGAPLREYLVQKLPDYMIPSRFIEMPALPLTPNGKLDRNTLPDPSGVPLAAPRPTAPRSETERRVAALWAGLLKTHVPDIHEDFFSLGGHSLLAAELSQRIHLEFGKRLSLPEIFGAPTIARLSELLDAEQHGAGQRCLYWIYGGTVFQPLAAHLRATCRWQDVWLPQELEETVSLSDRLEDVARHLVDGMRSHPANGAYHLGGWCIAGILAYEVAVQLEALGEEVALVALLGAPNPRHYAAIPRHERVKSKLQYHWNQMTCLDAAGASRYLVERARHQVQKHKPVQFRDFNRILEELALRYEPKPLHARVALFQGQDRPSMFDYAPGWREVVKGEFLAYDVPGNHSTSLEEPHVAVLAGKLRDCLGQGPELRRPFTQ
jgi:thioesterase domain-containing protein